MLQIAIVEDEADLAQQTKDNVVRYLNEHGLEGNIAVFNDGMDIAENYKPIWDILLLDIEMPLLNGMSAAQKIREQDATVVMIFITRMAKYAIKGYAEGELRHGSCSGQLHKCHGTRFPRGRGRGCGTLDWMPGFYRCKCCR